MNFVARERANAFVAFMHVRARDRLALLQKRG